MEMANIAKHKNFTDARDLRPALYKGLYATAARLVQKVVAGADHGNRALWVKLSKMLYVPRVARYQQALRRYHSRKVNARSFEEGDLVLRRVQSAKNSNKLTPKWEGPYRVRQVTRPGAVRLETEEGLPVSNSWNIEHLRKFHP